MNFFQFLKSRRSHKGRFSPDAPSDDLVEKVCEVARWAPSAHNAQPWRVVVVRNGPLREALVERMAGRFRSDLLADGTDPELAERKVKRSRETFLDAPLLLVVCGDLTCQDAYPDDARRRAEEAMLVQSVAAFTQQLLLAAHASGLAGCWYCAPLFAGDVVRDVCGLPAHWWPLAFVTLGTPLQEGEATRRGAPPRRPVEEFVKFVGGS